MTPSSRPRKRSVSPMKAARCLAPVDRSLRRRFQHDPRGTGLRFRRRQPEDGELIAAFEVTARRLVRGAPLLVDQPGQPLGKGGARIARRRAALRFDKERPAGLEAPQRVVEARGRGDQLALGRAVEIRSAKARRALERAVLVQHHAGRDQSGPGQPIGEQRTDDGDIRRGSAWVRHRAARDA